MRQLIHNGVLVPRYERRGFCIEVKGQKTRLTLEQEEMVVAWVRKLGTERVKDKLFVKNFFKDFCKTLNIKEKLSRENFDFSMVQEFVEREKTVRLGLSKEEKKRLVEQRKADREANKERYGYAMVDGARTEISNFMVEPSSIFMGRGKHPLRGRWKRGGTGKDIILNLSPDAPIPKGNWKEIVWRPEEMWIAKWRDNLTGKVKYVWLSDQSQMKQIADITKFSKSLELQDCIDKVREHITSNLESGDPFRRKIATACYLIDILNLRVGDEKDKDEADTVGATTLRPEHIKINPDGLVTFDFLGKDSVRWHKEERLPEIVIGNLERFRSESESSIFKGVRSKNVSLFLGEVMLGLTAKVFRTYHASNAVKRYFAEVRLRKEDPECFKKSTATVANLQAAVICNHKRKPPKNWNESMRKNTERLKKLRSKKTKKARETAKALNLRIKVMKMVRDYNLRTSLKSYIDPRIYYQWGKEVDYDWKLYYPKTLQRKFSWVESLSTESQLTENTELNNRFRAKLWWDNV